MSTSSVPVLAVAVIMLVSLNAYALFGGADFGGGVWDLLAAGPRRDRQRALIAHAIGPIWEANHVWLILVVVLLFTCFPAAFAGLAIVLHVPLTLMLVGIVLRGSAFTFRSYGSEDDAVQRRWGRVFAIASVVTPLALGVCIGAVASERAGDALAVLRQELPGAPHAGFADVFVRPWLAPFPLVVGALSLSLFAFLAATYLTVEADDEALREDFRRRALLAALAVFVCAFGALGLAGTLAPRMRSGLTVSPWAIPLHALTAASAITAIAGLWTRRYRMARAAAAAQVSLILWGWAAAQFPYLVPPGIAIGDAAPRRTLVLVLIALAFGAVVLMPSLAYLYRVFKRKT